MKIINGLEKTFLIQVLSMHDHNIAEWSTIHVLLCLPLLDKLKNHTFKTQKWFYYRSCDLGGDIHFVLCLKEHHEEEEKLR